jgi:hypothetical protein
MRTLLNRFSPALRMLPADTAAHPSLLLGADDKYNLYYIPFEYANLKAKLVLVGITPGPNQMKLAYEVARRELESAHSVDRVLREVKRAAAFGGTMRGNLVKMLNHFGFNRLLDIEDAASLWDDKTDLVQTTSVVLFAAFTRQGKMFNGSFEEVTSSPLLFECFQEWFVEEVKQLPENAMYVAMGPTPLDALRWCVKHGALRADQIMGSFAHPSPSGGSAVSYYLRERKLGDLNPKDPVRYRTEWLNKAYDEMKIAVQSRSFDSGNGQPYVELPDNAAITRSHCGIQSASNCKPVVPSSRSTTNRNDHYRVAAIRRIFQARAYQATRETKKVVEFESPDGSTLYVRKKESLHGKSVRLVAHPKSDPRTLREMPGVVKVGLHSYHNSNMIHFPKHQHRGKNKIPYGLPFEVASLGALRSFLDAFNRAPDLDGGNPS